MNSIRPLQSYILYITIIALLMIVSWNINGLINPDINIRSTRSWIEGIACIGLGAIVGYYNIPQKLRVHVWHLIVVAIVSVIQYELVLHCFNVTLEINMTSILLSLLILIYAVNHPYFGHNCIINKIGLHHSTTIYIIHIIIGNELGHLALRHSWWQQVLFPILVFLVSWVCACLWKIISKYAGELINTQKG